MNKPSLSRWEVGLLGAIVVYAVLAYLPWTHDVTIANVSLFAWLLFALMVLAPLSGLLVALRPEDGE
jgi:antibiotic biosynthesis monooxygenase (ABM) superfamily enzyme